MKIRIAFVSSVVSLLVCSFAGCGAASDAQLIGVWRPAGASGGASDYSTIEFASDGYVRISGDTSPYREFEFIKLLAEFGATPALDSIKYRQVSEGMIEVSADYSELLGPLSGGAEEVTAEQVGEAMKTLKPKERLKYEATGQKLTLSNASGKTLELERVE